MVAHSILALDQFVNEYCDYLCIKFRTPNLAVEAHALRSDRVASLRRGASLEQQMLDAIAS